MEIFGGNTSYLTGALGMVANPLPGAPQGAWSLVTKLGDFLHRSEQKFGPRDKRFTILGVEFAPTFGSMTATQVWYPGAGDGRKHIVVRLSMGAALDPRAAVFELSHETVHLLAPNGGGMATVVEEGMATMFSREICAAHGWAEYAGASITADYQKAEELVRDFLHLQPTAIKTIRCNQPAMQSWSASLITDYFSDVSATLAKELCEPFALNNATAVAAA
jgi:hypothetical protein